MSEQIKDTKPKVQLTLKDLEKRIDNMERCFAKVCHMTGTERNLTEFDIPKFVPGEKDMHKKRG